MTVEVSVVILAAGQGTRMRSRLPKVLQPLAGQPLLWHVIATAEALKAHKICLVYGHGGEQVREIFAERDLVWVLQETLFPVYLQDNLDSLCFHQFEYRVDHVS